MQGLKLNHLFLAAVLAAMFCSCEVKHDKYESRIMNEGWEIQSSQYIEADGQEISQVQYESHNWIKGDIPATVMSILRQNGQYANMFMGMNIEQIDNEQFRLPWWYRKTFELGKKEKASYQIRFEGLNYKANIWLNGHLLADSTRIEGAFGRWTLEAGEWLVNGKNSLAVEVIPPKKGDLTIGFVDWNPTAPDDNMGLWRGVELIESGGVTIEAPMVASVVDKEGWASAGLTVRCLLTNHDDIRRKVRVNADLEGVARLTKEIILEPLQEKDVVFTPAEYPELNVKNPKLWWPNNMGEAYLYNMKLSAETDGRVSDACASRFGIREIEEYLTADGHKGYKVNGRPLIIKGAGWVDDMMLADTDDKVRAQVDYVRHMNMNCIRLEGFWGRNKTLYEAADENGLLLMIGWSCQWEWEAYCGRPETNFMAITGKDEMRRHTQSYRDQVMYLRQHPSVFLWVFGSDKLPVAELETMLNASIGEADGTRPMLASCKGQDYGTDFYNESTVSGHTGVKMLGPYSYVPPVYWYVADEAGGAYGFNTETGPGAQVPPLESLKRMIPEDHLWPVDEVWDYHCGRHEFGSLDRFRKAFDERYGKSHSVEDFTFRSQIANYEAMRPMFEAFQANRNKQATGVIQWMLNSAWPEMFWQLYDYYLVPNGAFYGAKKACQPLHLIYNYGDKAIYLSNDYTEDKTDLYARVQVYDSRSKKLFSKEINTDVAALSTVKLMDVPEINGLGKTYFIALDIRHNGQLLSDNFYWLSGEADEMDFPKTTWVGTPQKGFADLQKLQTLPKADVTVMWSDAVEDNNKVVTAKMTNNSECIAFFLEAAVLDGQTQQTIVPVFWSDNYISLLPGETKSISARLDKALIEGVEKVEYRLRGANID